MIKQKACGPEASLSMHNLERIDASRGWLGVILRIPAFLHIPHLDKIAKLLDPLHDAALEETVRLGVGIVLLHEHVGSQENGITLACRCILCGRRLRNNVQYPRLGVLTRPPATLLSFARYDPG